MLTPEFLDGLPDTLIKLYAQAERDILMDMARRIGAYDYWIPAAEHQKQMLKEMGAAEEYIYQRLAELTGKSTEELKTLFLLAANETLTSDGESYRAAGQEPETLDTSENLQKTLTAGMRQTQNVFKNLTRTTARESTGVFLKVLDRAWMQISTETFDYNAAIRSAVKTLAEKGIQTANYDSGKSTSIEAAVRRAVLTGINQTSLKMQDTLADEMDSDLIEVTAHSGARPEHAKWQGKVYSRSGKSKKYPDFRKSTGYGTGAGLGGWNCRHNFFPFFEGSPRKYSEKQLKKLEEKDIEYNGQKMTKYEVSQKQRYIERQIRRWKRENAAMQAAGLDTYESAAKIKKWQDIQKDFIKQTKLKRQYERERVPGFDYKAAKQVERDIDAQKKIEKQKQERYNKKKEEAIQLIKSDTTSKSINRGHQNKHIKDSDGYIEGRSYIFGTLEDAQELVDRYHGTGEVKLTASIEWTHKEFVVADEPIGVWIDNTTGKEYETRRFSIHYGKKGTHIVPAKEVEEE